MSDVPITKRLHQVSFHASGRGKARCASNPAFPDGITINLVNLAEEPEPQNTCCVELPYPAPECGHILVVCTACVWRLAISAAGRADDPRTLIVPCGAMRPPQGHA